MVHKMEHIFNELDKLNCVLPDPYKSNLLMIRIKDVAPEIYTPIAQKSKLSYAECVIELKHLVVYNTAVDKANLRDIGSCYTMSSKPTKYKNENRYRNSEKKSNQETKYWKAEKNQCYWCLKKGHIM